MSTPEVAGLIDGAKYFYVEGYFLTHGVESALEVAKKASDSGKVRFPSFLTAFVEYCAHPSPQVFAINLSAPFIPQFFKVQLEQLFLYCDYVIGNESEAAAWASAAGLPDKDDISATAKSIALLPKSNPSRPRTVIITQGSDSTIVVCAADADKPKIFSVDRLEDQQIVDTNGAGDAFAGGFLGAIVSGKSVDEAVLAGHKMGAMCVQLVSTVQPPICSDLACCRLDPSILGPRLPCCRLFLESTTVTIVHSQQRSMVEIYNTCIISRIKLSSACNTKFNTHMKSSIDYYG